MSRVVGWCQGAAGEVGELAGGGDGVAFMGGEAVVGVVGDGEWCGGAGEAVPDDVVVAAGAEQDADGGGVAVLVAEVVVDPGDVEPELAGVLGLEAADLELDHDEAGLGPVKEQQVDVEVVAVDLEVVLPADEGEAVAKLEGGLPMFGATYLRGYLPLSGLPAQQAHPCATVRSVARRATSSSYSPQPASRAA